MSETIRYGLNIALPFTKPPITENMRLNRYKRADLVRQIRYAVHTQLLKHRAPKGLDHVTVALHYTPPDNRRRDADNLVPTLKAACDAIAAGTKKHPGYGMVKDDTPDLMTKHMPIIEPPIKDHYPTLILKLTWTGEKQ